MLFPLVKSQEPELALEQSDGPDSQTTEDKYIN